MCAHGWKSTGGIAAAGTQELLPPHQIAMSRQVLQRREFDQPVREQLVDEAFARYLDWLAECEAVEAAYGTWSRARRVDAALSFAAYGAALYREERAAAAYRSVIDRVAQLSGGEERLTRAAV